MFYSWKVAKINSMNEVGAVILAGGMGARFHGQKQFFRKVLDTDGLIIIGIVVI